VYWIPALASSELRPKAASGRYARLQSEHLEIGAHSSYPSIQQPGSASSWTSSRTSWWASHIDDDEQVHNPGFAREIFVAKE
jgi:hypothetical protein